jgi:hypothetical protein
MSEHSDCYYLKGLEPAGVASLLKRARRYGLIAGQADGWVPFLVDGIADAGHAARAVTQHNVGVLLHYSYAEDQAILLRAFEGAEESFVIEVRRHGPSEVDAARARPEAERLRLVRDADALTSLLSMAGSKAQVDLAIARQLAREAFGCPLHEATTCADLSRESELSLRERFPDAQFILKSRRGLADTEHGALPNEWCPAPGLPAWMYLPVPRGSSDEELVERHVQHWLTTADFDAERQAGSWLLTAYQRALPSRYRFLADRMTNLRVAFPDSYERALRETVCGILAVSQPDFDWQPYFDRKKGEIRR